MTEAATTSNTELKKLEQQISTLVNERPMACRIGLLVVLAVVGYVAVLDPGLSAIAATKHKIKSAIETSKALAKIETGTSVMASLSKRLPPWTSHYQWMEQFLDAARDNGVRLENLQPSVAAKSFLADTEQVDIEMTLAGTYPRVVQFVAWLETERPFYRVVGLSLSKRGEGALSCVLKLRVMQQKGEVGA